VICGNFLKKKQEVEKISRRCGRRLSPLEGVVEDVNAVILLANLCYVFHEFFKEKLRAAFTAGARGRLPPS
jgi:hypothetical protein